MNEETKISSIVDMTISDIIFKSVENFLERIIANTYNSFICVLCSNFEFYENKRSFKFPFFF